MRLHRALLLVLPFAAAACIPAKTMAQILLGLKFLSAVLGFYDIPAGAALPLSWDAGGVLGDRVISTFGGGPPPEGAAPAGTVPNEVLALASEQEDGFGVLQLRRELRHPFHVEVTTGVFDDALLPLLDGGFSAFELDVIGSSPLQFITAGAQPVVTAGAFTTMNVFVSTDAGTQGQLLIPAPIVDFALQSNGTNVDVSARAHGDVDWLPVASVPSPAPDDTWYGSVGVAGLGAGGGLAFDGLVLLANGPSGAKPGTVDEALEQTWDAWGSIFHACNLIEGPAPDTAGAQAELLAAVANLDAARATTQALLDAGGASAFIKKARKQLLLSGGKAASSHSKLEAGAKLKGVVKRLKKAEAAGFRALGALRADTLIPD